MHQLPFENFQKPRTILDALADVANLHKTNVEAKFAEPMAQSNLDKIKALIAETNLGNQKSQALLPFAVPHEQATIRDILAQAKEREEETRHIPQKYSIQQGNLNLRSQESAPEQLKAKLEALQALTRQRNQALGNVETDAYGNPISSNTNIGGQQNAGNPISSAISKETEASNVGIPQGLPPLHDKDAIKEWISSGRATPEKIQQFRSLLSKSQEQPINVPPQNETFRKSATARMVGGQPSERLGSEGGKLKLIPAGAYGKMSEQYHAIKQVKPELDLLMNFGRKLYAGVPLTPDEKDAYDSQLALVKDTFVGATHLPKLRQTFNTIHEILGRKKFTTSKEYQNKLVHLQNKLNHDLQELEYPMSTGYEYFPGKK